MHPGYHRTAPLNLEPHCSPETMSESLPNRSPTEPALTDYVALFQQSPGLFLVLRADSPRFTIAAASDEYLKATMTRREDIAGRGVFEVFPDNPDDPAAQGAHHVRASLQRVIATGKIDRMPVQKYDIRSPGEQERFEVRHWSPTNSPVFDSNGKISYIMHRVEDVTGLVALLHDDPPGAGAVEIQDRDAQAEVERSVHLAAATPGERDLVSRLLALEKAGHAAAQTLARELATKQRFLSLSQKVAHLGSWELDLKSEPVTAIWSEELEEVYGLAPGTFGGKFSDWVEFLHAHDKLEASESLLRAIRTGDLWQCEFRIVRADGEVRWIVGRGQCIYDGAGKPLQMIGINMDITERKQSEEALRKSEKLATTGRLAGTIAHEINNPLSSVKNLIYLIETDPSTTQAVAKYARMADEEITRISHITNQALGFYREATAPVEVHITEILDSVLTLFARRIQAAGVSVEKRYQTSVPLQGWPGEMRQVFTNLVSNALEASNKGGALKVHVFNGREGGVFRRRGVRVVIADQGVGIASDAGRKLFEPFYTTKGEKGTGLGLWVSHGIVQKHGGYIKVRSSTRPGRSFTLFNIFLPVRGVSTGMALSS